MLTRDYTVVNNSDTDPQVVYYDITNKETALNEGLDPEDVDGDMWECRREDYLNRFKK